MKKILLVLLTVLLMLGSFASCDSGDAENVPSTVITTEKAPENIEPPSENLQTTYEICFMCGNLMEVKRNADGQVVEENCTEYKFCYTYDENDKILQVEFTEKESFVIQTFDVQYESDAVANVMFEGDVLMRLTFDENGDCQKKEFIEDYGTTLYYENQRIVKIEKTEPDLCLSMECQYENGFLKMIVGVICEEGKEPQKIGEAVYSYNAEGRVEQILSYEIVEGASEFSGKCLYSYYSDGTWSREEYNRYNSYNTTENELSLYEKLTYDANWNLLESIKYDEEENAEDIKRYDYKIENGNSMVTVRYININSGLTEREQRYINGGLNFEGQYTYDQNGALVGKTENEFENGIHKRSTIYDYQYKVDGVGGYLRVTVYDVKNNGSMLQFVLVSDVIYDSNGNIYTPGSPDVTPPHEEETTQAIQYEYCMCGGIARVNRNAQGQVAEENCWGHSTYYTYGTDGRLIKCRFTRDTVGSQEYDVVYETDRVAKVVIDDEYYLKLTYDENKNIVKKESFADNLLVVLKYDSDRQVKEMTISSGNELFDYEIQYQDHLWVQIDVYAVEDSGNYEIAEILFAYDENGRLCQVDQNVFEGVESIPMYSVRFVYEDDGSVIREMYAYQNSTALNAPFLSESVKYDSEGRVLENVRYYDNESYVTRYEYLNGTVVSGTRYEYQDGVLDEKNKVEYVYENGNLIKEIYYKEIEVLGVGGYLQVQTWKVGGLTLYSFGYLMSSSCDSTVVYDPNGEIYSENGGISIPMIYIE